MEVHQAGGGIHFTVEQTRKATEEQLFTLLKQRLLRMIRGGTTLVECKSGYGLNTDTELKMLRVIEMARDLKCHAISHLEEVSKDGIKAMACTKTVAVILPTTAYILRLRPPPV